MSQPAASKEDATAPSPAESAGVARAADDLAAIRELLFGQEKRQLEVLQERVEDPGLHAQDVGRVLPRAVTLASAKGPELARSLTPAVEFALKESVKRDPSILVNAIFPIIGPAIRKAVAEAFSKLVQSLNQALEHSFSPRSLKWRLEAMRTHRSFAEVVLAHTLVYRVEQVFLVHRKTGLLLKHVTAPQVRAEDGSLVSAMLTAIQDFAQDSFRVPAGELLHTVQIGDLTLWVESSPSLAVAAAIRGHAPHEFRTVLQSALENVHGELGKEIEAFDGDAAPFEPAHPSLERCLQAQFVEATERKRPNLFLPILAGATVLGVAVWLFISVRDDRRWDAFLKRIGAEPGVVVTDSGRRDGKRFVAGLRDPLAVDPMTLLPEFDLEAANVTGRWEPYHALTPGLVAKRAEALLSPPAGVTLQLQDGVLFASGKAPADWIRTARTKAPALSGVRGYDDSALVDETETTLAARLAARRQDVERTVIFFEDGFRPKAGQEAAIERLAAQLEELRRAAAGAGWSVRVSVVGHSDRSGTEELNLRLSQQRADYIVALLVAGGVREALLAPTGIGAREPLRAGMSDEEQTQNRRVTFKVALERGRAP